MADDPYRDLVVMLSLLMDIYEQAARDAMTDPHDVDRFMETLAQVSSKAVQEVAQNDHALAEALEEALQDAEILRVLDQQDDADPPSGS